jgi:alginate O-acetyltransferase complex protein AlgI
MFWRVDYSIILVVSTLIDFTCSNMMVRYKEKSRRKPWLWLSIFSNLAILFTFKYYNFFNTALQDLATVIDIPYVTPAFELLLPMGISFYTFQTMSYSIDVYNGRTKAEKHIGVFGLFVTFFPQLVAGPIERADNLLKQIREDHQFNRKCATQGLQLILWGLLKKIVIADRIAIIVDQVYTNPTEYESISLIIATILFAVQIYCDFSGYSDIAIGSAQVLGFKLMENFRSPYFSKSIKEFWARWHISLSTWFRDFLYIPLGGNRVLKWRWYYNLFIVFIISGLWHGANWTFIIWGALHGVYQIFGYLTARQRDALIRILGINKQNILFKLAQTVTTFALVCFAWIFFRSNNIGDAWHIINEIFFSLPEDIYAVLRKPEARREMLYFGSTRSKLLLVAFIPILIFITLDYFKSNETLFPFFHKQPVIIRWASYYVAIGLIIYLAETEVTNRQFIYFQF